MAYLLALCRATYRTGCSWPDRAHTQMYTDRKLCELQVPVSVKARALRSHEVASVSLITAHVHTCACTDTVVAVLDEATIAVAVELSQYSKIKTCYSKPDPTQTSYIRAEQHYLLTSGSRPATHSEATNM